MTRENENKPQSAPEEAPGHITRRTFLVTAASAVGLAVAVNCAPVSTEPTPAPTPIVGPGEKFLHVPPAPRTPPTTFRYLNADQVRTLDAFIARLMPGTPGDPGAREAGVALFIDNILATTSGFIEPTYIGGPFAKGYEGETPPPDEPGVIWVPKAELPRYGFQMRFTPHEIYEMGLQGLDGFAQETFGANFADLTASQQDELITQMASGSSLGSDAEGEALESDAFGDLSPKSFFEYVHRHIIHGMFSDPLYGGNRGFAGWNLVGYPGSQRAYTVADMRNEQFSVAPQGLEHLDPLHPGHRTRPEIILPVQSGREYE
jgi:gluconate 2-dehydrogenase gamma chain